MKIRFASAWAAAALLIFSSIAGADEPKAIPATRDEMKEALDSLKHRKPRLPLPAATEEELERAKQAAAERGSGGGQGGLRGGIVNNGRMRQLYIPREMSQNPGGGGNRPAGSGPRQGDPSMKFDYRFSTELFWIVSRINNCHYCLGHQEEKLRSAGATDDDLAAMDLDWSHIPGPKQAAYAFTMKLTARPDALTQEDFDAIAKHYSPREALEIIFLVSRYNATNRWTDSLGIPQEENREFKTPTPQKFVGLKSKVALLDVLSPKGTAQQARGEWEARDVVKQKWSEARSRTPRFSLAEAPEEAPEGSPANLARLLNNFPQSGSGQLRQLMAARTMGKLAPKVKAEIAWTCARTDRAWYALDLARRSLEQVGVSEEQAFELSADNASLPDGERAAIGFAKKLTERPQHMTDDDIESLRKHFSDHETAEIVHHVTLAAFLDRISEAALLPLEK
jgi:alkylhydroperoxidase family enzyme